MVPLFAGGQSVSYRRPAGFEAPGTAFDWCSLAIPAIAFLLAVQAAFCLGVSCATAAESSVVTTAATPGNREGAVVLGLFAPGTVQSPAGRADWTLRGKIAAARVAEAGSQAAPRHYAGPRANVSMFPWREIVFYGLVFAIAIGGLLALTGGQDRQSRHY